MKVWNFFLFFYDCLVRALFLLFLQNMPKFMNNRVDLGLFSFSWAVWEVVTGEIDLGH